MEELSTDQLLKKQEVSSETLLPKAPEVQSDALVLRTDQDYFDAYFYIGRLYQEKRHVLGLLQKAGHDTEITGPIQKNIFLLNGGIKKAEGSFWDTVEKAQKEGAKFVFEGIASRFQLKIFEKRVLLFFYYLEYHDIRKNVCMEDDLLLLFDLENSVISRMAHFKYFIPCAALFENALLYHGERKSYKSARMEISLSNTALVILSEGLNGEKPVIESPKKELSSDFDSVGYVKEPEYTMDDVLLKDDIKDKVKLFLDAFRDNKLEAMGIKERIKKGLGTVFLFYGPPGTGKSMLAEAIAKYVNKKMLMVEYPKIMERWVGATDKNISNIFKVAGKDDLVVVLDEADTLFYNRAFAFEEHDIRFVNEMLQELERFNGMIILTTNMTELLDQALERRISLKVKFENPTKEARLKIWQSHIPKQLKLSEDADFNYLADKYDFAGGNIKNAVLNALRKMVSRNGDTLLMQYLIFGADMEKDGMYSALHKEPMGFIAN